MPTQLVSVLMRGIAFLLFVQPLWAQAESCTKARVAIQELGSGGPEITKRSGPSHLLWLNGKAKLLLDAGPGTFLRLGQSGAVPNDISAILLSHLHVDHANDVPALVKAAFFDDRNTSLPIYGPSGNDAMPGVSAWIDSTFGINGYRYLSEYLSPNASGFSVVSKEIDANNFTLREVAQIDGLRISAAAVQHGSIPALAYRIEGNGFVLAYSGDTRGDGQAGEALRAIAKDATVFIVNHAIPNDTDKVAGHLHITPAQIGTIAKAAHPKLLWLSHRMRRTLGHEAATRAEIAKKWTGPTHFTNDLECMVLVP